MVRRGDRMLPVLAAVRGGGLQGRFVDRSVRSQRVRGLSWKLCDEHAFNPLARPGRFAEEREAGFDGGVV